MLAANGRFTLSATTAAKQRERASGGEEHVKCNEEKCKLRYIVCFAIKKIEGEMLSGREEVRFLPNHSSVLLLFESNPGCTAGGEKSVNTFLCETFGFVIFWLKGMTWVECVMEVLA